jgi:hypothetical protein
MARDEILNMEAGREMDALVAEKVMGYERVPDIKPYGFGDAWLQHYSTDIAAAWQVVGKLENNDFWWEASNVVPNSDPIVYEWKFVTVGRQGEACEFTAPLAICRAALLATLEG